MIFRCKFQIQFTLSCASAAAVVFCVHYVCQSFHSKAFHHLTLAASATIRKEVNQYLIESQTSWKFTKIYNINRAVADKLIAK